MMIFDESEMRVMKLKYRFLVSEVSGEPIAVAVGRDNELFNGMIRLNSTGAFVFSLLNERDATEDQLTTALSEEYDISKTRAGEVLARFLEYLRNNDLLTE